MYRFFQHFASANMNLKPNCIEKVCIVEYRKKVPETGHFASSSPASYIFVSHRCWNKRDINWCWAFRIVIPTSKEVTKRHFLLPMDDHAAPPSPA